MISDRKPGLPGQGTQHVSYEKLKGFASFALEHELDRAARLSLEISRSAQTPLLGSFAHFNEAQLLEITKKSMSDFLEQVVKGEALQEAKKSIYSWKEGEIEGISREAIQISDFILAYSACRQVILQLLPDYTSDCHLIVDIMKELEVFYQFLEQFAFGTYVAVQQEVLHEKNNFLTSLISNSADGILAYDKQLKITEWNPALEKSLGKLKNEVLGKAVTDVFPAIENAPVIMAFKESLKGKRVHLPTTTYSSRSEVYEANVTPLFGEENNITGGLAHIHDITHRVETEETLKEHQEELQTANEALQAANEELTEQRHEAEAINGELQENLTQLQKTQVQLQRLVSQLEEAQAIVHLGSFEYLVNNDQVLWSEEMKRIFGLAINQSALTYQEYLQFIFEEDRPLVQSVVEEALAMGKAYTLEHRIVRPGGELRWIYANGKTILNKGKVVKLQGTALDITERKLAEKKLKLTNYTLHETNEELIRTEKLLKEANNKLENQVVRRTAELQSKNEQLIRINADLDNFIYTASHDLKAPIANLEGLLVLLHKKLLENLPEKDQQLLGMMQASVERLKKTILDLSDVTKMQKELEEEERENVILQEVVDDIQQDLAALIREHEATVHVNLQVKEVAFDRKNMRSILYNLLTNAIKYRSASRPEVYITTEPCPQGLLLCVRDNGEGIPQKQYDRIFSLFKRLNKTVDGSGMGLYIVKKIVNNNGGRIDVDSQVGEGTTFKIYLKDGTETD